MAYRRNDFLIDFIAEKEPSLVALQIGMTAAQYAFKEDADQHIAENLHYWINSGENKKEKENRKTVSASMASLANYAQKQHLVGGMHLAEIPMVLAKEEESVSYRWFKSYKSSHLSNISYNICQKVKDISVLEDKLNRPQKIRTPYNEDKIFTQPTEKQIKKEEHKSKQKKTRTEKDLKEYNKTLDFLKNEKILTAALFDNLNEKTLEPHLDQFFDLAHDLTEHITTKKPILQKAREQIEPLTDSIEKWGHEITRGNKKWVDSIISDISSYPPIS